MNRSDLLAYPIPSARPVNSDVRRGTSSGEKTIDVKVAMSLASEIGDNLQRRFLFT
jgi:hypothetical protein